MLECWKLKLRLKWICIEIWYDLSGLHSPYCSQCQAFLHAPDAKWCYQYSPLICFMFTGMWQRLCLAVCIWAVVQRKTIKVSVMFAEVNCRYCCMSLVFNVIYGTVVAHNFMLSSTVSLHSTLSPVTPSRMHNPWS